MNKQQLANKIWATANKMRSKIEANEYKDYILGFIFYKYLSDNELKFLKENSFSTSDIQNLDETDSETVKYIRENLGYFISYKDLYSTWLTMGKDFDISNVTDALSAFNRLINPTHKQVFEKIFNTLESGLSKLGDTSGQRTKAISDLIHLLKDIPMHAKQDYDILGYIYEYLIGMFAANAGKKAGEFYTPHEVSQVMSEIISDHLKDRREIQIYDPTSGSGSLLLNIGRSVAKHIANENNIKYYAQELKQNTYNLTRMNLVMRGILPDNIVTRNADTLEEDWPYFDESNRVETYDPLYVDAVVSNPPYSQHWDPKDKENDPRYARFGLAPKSKADYAFLLHDLFHVKPDGIMTIVLPHGVLFRGGEEGTIRKNLIESNHIDTVIGLPAGIFFGTGIPTIILVLKQKRTNTDILIVDASKGFVKEGKNNRLRSSDIKQIVDTVLSRSDVEGYSRKVSREEIRENEYNLNIPRYVDSSEKAESWDLYASMFGGIPIKEINELDQYWKAFPGLKETLFKEGPGPYAELIKQDTKMAINDHPSVKAVLNQFLNEFNDYPQYLKRSLLDSINEIKVLNQKDELISDLFSRLDSLPLVNKYEAYQLLDDKWTDIEIDLEVIQTEGFEATTKVDPNMIIKKKGDTEFEVQDGWKGHILPFDLVQSKILTSESEELSRKQSRLLEVSSELEEILASFTDEEKESGILNDSNDAFNVKGIAEKIKEIYQDIEIPETKSLNDYNQLTNKADKIAYINSHKEVNWSNMKAGNDGTYKRKTVDAYLVKLQENIEFEEESFEARILKAESLIAEEKELKSEIKKDSEKLHLKTKERIKNLTDQEVNGLLENKWIVPLVESIRNLPSAGVDVLVQKLNILSNKYATTYSEIETELEETSKNLALMIDDLVGNEQDINGLQLLKNLLVEA